MTRLILLRHGQTDWNEQNRFQGRADVLLNETGVAQARAVAPALAALKPVSIRSSDLSRAFETARIVAKACELKVQGDPRLRETDVGELSGLSHEDFAERFPDGYAAWVDGRRSYVEYGGEGIDEAAARISEVVAEVPDDDGTHLLVAHGALIRSFVCALLGSPESGQMRLTGLANCGWVVLERTAGERQEAGGWRLAAYNRVADFASGEGVE